LDDLDAVMQEIRDYGQVDSPICPDAIKAAEAVIKLLDEYNGLPNKSQAIYDQKKSKFEEMVRFLDDWCTDFPEYS